MGGRQQRVNLRRRVSAQWPAWSPGEVDRAIAEGEVHVDGRVLANPLALVAAGAAVRHVPPGELAGRRKLGWALEHFGVDATGRVVLDVGASTGGFTQAWLEAGAVRVHAVDVGHGQLLGSLRQDPRVVVRERTNVADVPVALRGEELTAASVDVSYLSLSAAIAQLAGAAFAPSAPLLGLVKPMFELRLPTIPDDPELLARACGAAVRGATGAGWQVEGVAECPVRGSRGAVEFFLYATYP
jgi:23S rRNA (cytidine1920-2'-O)/16S rRNA (cytidine1409-2'-O)-methyltransferase